MVATTQLDVRELEGLLSNYAVGVLDRHWPAANGIENTNYFVRVVHESGSSEYVLTLLEQPSHPDALLIPLLDVCAGAGLPVAPVLAAQSGAKTVCFRGKQALLSPRLPGRHALNPTVPQCEAVGRFLARFHRVAVALLDTASPHPRDGEWLEDRTLFVASRLPHADRSTLRDAVDTVRSMLARRDVDSLPRGIIHGDLFRDNVLFAERGLTGVLDFHHAAAGFLLYDLAVAANDWCTDGDGVIDAERALALLRPYHAIRPLTLPEQWYFPMFMLYAGLAFWLSRLAPAIRRDGTQCRRLKNPDEMKRIVERHLSRAFYLDGRLLDYH